jgi:UDP-N-acetylglucosamine/UDP-N-acetyl-alpha-D-glucosaminouronate 4-epimerase
MRVLVTGGGGFIGSHVVDRLLAEGHEVRALDNFTSGRRENLDGVLDDIELVEGDIQSYERAHTAVRGCDVVLHQAALPSVPRSVLDPLTSNASNVIGTLNVLLAARDSGVRRVVLASSSSVYGSNPELPKHEALQTRPIAPYGVAKLAAEGYAQSFYRVYGLNTVVLRYFNVFGPRQDPRSEYAAVIPKFIASAFQGTSPVIFGDGEQTRDFTYVDNVVQANLLAMEAPEAAAKVFNVAYGESVTLNRLVQLIGEITGRELIADYAAPRPGDVRHSRADITLARTELGYEPEVDFTEGLRRTAEWHAAKALQFT